MKLIICTMKEIIKNIFYFKRLIDSYYGVEYGWEIIYNDKKIAELDFTYTRCVNQYLYEVININGDFTDLKFKEILEFKATFRNKYFNSKVLKPEIDFICTYYPKFNKLGAEYMLIYDHEDIRYNRFYKMIISIIHFYREFFPIKRGKELIINENCSEMIPRWWLNQSQKVQ
ncbi:hypothetical protein [Flavobacterium sp.]|uniref:hypothetical protein n=1 Tax=Flavobacterium sp. TaxID=239 RepID=UPI002619699B|nr:hypothetical protein [Flavobacterium sp.]